MYSRLVPTLLWICLLTVRADSFVRIARDGINGQDVGVNIEWLTDEQLSELSEADGQETRMDKLRQFFDAMEAGPAKTEAAAKIWTDCYDWLKEVATEEEQEELKKLHHSDHGKCKQKVAELLDRVESAKKEEIKAKMPFCEHAWYSSSSHGHDAEEEEGAQQQEDDGQQETASEHQGHHHHHMGKRWVHRHRRDHHEGHAGDHGQHSLDDYFRTHLAWLSDDQKADLKAMREQGKPRAELQEKVMGLFDAAEGDTKQQAVELMQGGCRELIKLVLGEEKALKLKEMRESGTEMGKIAQQIEEWVAAVEDQHKKEIAAAYKPLCAKVFNAKKTAAARLRREEAAGEQKLEQLLDTHLGWLSDDQKEQLKAQKAEGKSRAEIREQVMTWFGQLEGEAKEKARELLKGGCRVLLAQVVGEQNALKLKEMRESGTSPETLAKEADRMLGEVQDEQKKAKAAEFGPSCKKIFGFEAASRRRRDHHQGHEGHEGHHGGHTLDDYFKTHLSWLSDAQKEQLKTLKGEGKTRVELQQKVMEWLGELESEPKEKATELLRAGCRELIKAILGEEKANEIRKMKEAGTEPEKMSAKLNEWIAELEDGHKKQMAAEYGPTCKKLFGVKTANRRRRDHHQGHEGHEAHHGGHTLDDYFKTHLSWLSDAQKEQLKTLKGEGKSRAELQQKVMEWLDELKSEPKEKATELLKSGCRELIKVILGEEKANEIRKMKEAGTEPEKMSAKLDEWIAELDDGHKKQMAAEYGPTCKKIFGVKQTAAGRMRRSRHRQHRWDDEEEVTDEEVQLEGRDEGEDDEFGHEHLDRHRNWLNRKQKKLLKGMRDRGHASHELHDKIHQFYEVSPDEVKATARGILQRGCEAILKRLFGDYKAEEIIQAREEGASNAEMDSKIDEALAQIRNPSKREEAGRFAMTCRRIFTMIERRRREVAPTAEKSLGELFKSHLSWLTPAQKEELKLLQDQGTGRSELQQKVMAWFGELEGQSKAQALEHLRDGCRELLVTVLGQQNADDLKRLKEGGATEEQLETKANELIGAVQDEQKKAKAKEFGPTCKQIFMAADRARREAEWEDN